MEAFFARMESADTHSVMIPSGPQPVAGEGPGPNATPEEKDPTE